MSTDRKERMRAIRDEIVNLTQSPLYDYRQSNSYFPVIGQGNHYADIMFIGEAPGKNEAEIGRPFCGASGRVLDELLESIRVRRGRCLRDQHRERSPAPIIAIHRKRKSSSMRPSFCARLLSFSQK